MAVLHWRVFSLSTNLRQYRSTYRPKRPPSRNKSLSKAGGPDKLPARFLKETANEIAPMYTHLFTQSYKFGQLPTSWKSATICPIFKNGKRSLPENYRPVSLTAIPCKIFEHILVSQIWSHLNKYDIITSLATWIPQGHVMRNPTS